MTEPTTPAQAPREFPWIVIAASVGFTGIALVLVSLVLQLPRFVADIGFGLFFAAAIPYGLALRGSFRASVRFRAESQKRNEALLKSMQEAQERLNAAHEEHLARLQEVNSRLDAISRGIRLPIIEQEVYTEILGLDPEQVVVMEWPEDGLRDRVGVYLKDGSIQVHQFTLDQMDQAAVTINERLDGPERDAPEEQP